MIAMCDGSVLWGQVQATWFLDVNHFARVTPWLHTPMRLLTEYGVVMFAGLLLLSWWLARRDGDLRRVGIALWAPIGALLALGLNQFVVAVVAEPRPYAAFPHVLVLVARNGDYSFPSDHAVLAGAVAAGVLLVHRRLGIVAAVLAGLMAFTRVYVGVHFPLDVVAGVVLGGSVAVASHVVMARPLTRLVHVLVRTPLRPLLTSAAPPAAGLR
jgi:undecaprenyl-diphosphatase